MSSEHVGRGGGTGPIYLDHNASTPPDVEVVEAMLPWLQGRHANPHSEHRHGRLAAAAVDQARASIGALIGADADDIVLTSGATESNNLVLLGVMSGGRGLLAITSIEHKSVAETALALEANGTTVVRIPVDRMGRVDASVVRAIVEGGAPLDRCLVSVIHANNEIGTIAPIAAISAGLKGTGALFHTDATQSVGKIRVQVDEDGIDFLSMSAHKLGGPMGIGAVYIAAGLKNRIHPLMYGGGQQDAIRPGTVPIFLAVGFGMACELAMRRREADAHHLASVCDVFVKALSGGDVRFEVLGDPQARLPGLLSIRFPGTDAADFLERLSGVLSASTGSACTAGELRASHVLSAIGLVEDEAREVARFGFGRTSTYTEATNAALAIGEAVRRVQCGDTA